MVAITYYNFEIYYFKIIIGSQEAVKMMHRVLWMFPSAFPNGDILQNYSIISKIKKLTLISTQVNHRPSTVLHALAWYVSIEFYFILSYGYIHVIITIIKIHNCCKGTLSCYSFICTLPTYFCPLVTTNLFPISIVLPANCHFMLLPLGKYIK